MCWRSSLKSAANHCLLLGLWTQVKLDLKWENGFCSLSFWLMQLKLAKQGCRMSEACLKKFFPACPWSSSMKEAYFGESSILDLSIGAARPSLTSLLLWQPLPCFLSSSSKSVIICGPWRLKKTCWVKSEL